jgi:hypothetical protein
VNALVGARVRITQHDTDGVAYSADGVIEALAAMPGQAMTPKEPKPWDCLIRIDGVSSVIPYNVVDLEILDDENLSSPLDMVIAGMRTRLVELDDENAALTAANAQLGKQILALEAAATKKGGKP